MAKILLFEFLFLIFWWEACPFFAQRKSCPLSLAYGASDHPHVHGSSLPLVQG